MFRPRCGPSATSTGGRSSRTDFSGARVQNGAGLTLGRLGVTGSEVLCLRVASDALGLTERALKAWQLGARHHLPSLSPLPRRGGLRGGGARHLDAYPRRRHHLHRDGRHVSKARWECGLGAATYTAWAAALGCETRPPFSHRRAVGRGEFLEPVPCPPCSLARAPSGREGPSIVRAFSVACDVFSKNSQTEVIGKPPAAVSSRRKAVDLMGTQDVFADLGAPFAHRSRSRQIGEGAPETLPGGARLKRGRQRVWPTGGAVCSLELGSRRRGCGLARRLHSAPPARKTARRSSPRGLRRPQWRLDWTSCASGAGQEHATAATVTLRSTPWPPTTTEGAARNTNDSADPARFK